MKRDGEMNDAGCLCEKIARAACVHVKDSTIMGTALAEIYASSSTRNGATGRAF